ncbi:MAG: CARDB domain-containing protein, partial [Actinomycetota bacterium]
GWRRGEVAEGGVYFQRYNGNGVDLNRDWPTVGYTYRPYTPGSEPETKAYRDVLTGIRDATQGRRFAGGIDLHGQLLAVAFSYTLLGSGQRDFRKNFSTVDQSLRAWEDQTKRLSWSPYIADANQNGQNDPGEDCPNRNVVVTSGNFPYCFADQWGTVTDTIGYQITGGLGDWFESSIGLGAVGIDNEMSMSHILPNNVYDPLNEQMHVDGNKGLIYSQLSSMLTEEDSDFVYEPPGKIGYVFDPHRLQVEAAGGPQNPGLPAQNDIDTLVPCELDCQGGTFVMAENNQPTLEFHVRGPNEGVFNGGITVQATFTNVDGIGAGSIPRLKLERFDDEGGGQWQTAASSYVQAQTEGETFPDLYLQSGQVVSVNDPVPGRWRVRLTSLDGSPTRLEVDFHPVTADDDPGQMAIDASSMDFFEDLNTYVPSGQELTLVTVDQVLADPTVLDQFDSVVVVDDFMPEFAAEGDAPFSGDPQTPISHTFGPEATVTGPDTFEFQVEGPPDADNDLMVVNSTWALDSDWDIYVERRRDDGSWEERGCQCTFVAKGEQLVVTAPEPGTWRVRLVNFLAVPQPVDVDIEFFSDPAIPDPGESRFTPAQFEQYAEALARFTTDGGNLVLTDGAVRGLSALGIVQPGQVGSSQPSGRGAVPRYEMNVSGRGNLCTPDSPEPLLKDVCLPGSAGGTARQAVEPTPLGYAPDGTLDPSARAKLTQFFVDRTAWEGGCGKANAVECTSALLGAGVGYGERHLGRGRIRIAGAMLPDPNFAPGGPRDMRFGVTSYALTFSAWQMFLNLVDYQRPPPLPDLVVEDITTASKVSDGRTARITATIANEGRGAAGASTTEFLLDGSSILGEPATASIPSGGSTQVSIDWNTAGVKGEHTIRVTADAGGTVEERAETNNVGVLTVTV